MNSDSILYYPDLDIWRDESGSEFVKNDFNPRQSVWLKVSGDVWSFLTNGQPHVLDWSLIKLPKLVVSELKFVVKQKLKKSSPSYITRAKYALIALSKFWHRNWIDFGMIKVGELVEIWNKLSPINKTYLREFYKQLASLDKAGASLSVSSELKSWKKRHRALPLEDVINWHPTKGAFTKTEEHLIRESLIHNTHLSIQSNAIRIAAWIILETGKRQGQVRSADNHSVKKIESGSGAKYYISLTPIKAQIGLPKRWWPITKKLADAIASYSKLPQVEKLQQKYRRLIVWDVLSLHENGQVSANSIRGAIRRFFADKLKLISPRTGNFLHVTATRLRHTVATRLAFNGASRDLIQEILEHDSCDSAKAYIDATLSDVLPQIEKADTKMGGFFDVLKDRYFNGEVVPELTGSPVAIPESETLNPLFVGSCGRNSGCDRHPFISCYGGCPNFLAWREQDHRKALAHIEAEIDKWERIPGVKDNEFLVKSYKDAKLGAIQVISLIESGSYSECQK